MSARALQLSDTPPPLPTDAVTPRGASAAVVAALGVDGDGPHRALRAVGRERGLRVLVDARELPLLLARAVVEHDRHLQRLLTVLGDGLRPRPHRDDALRMPVGHVARPQ